MKNSKFLSVILAVSFVVVLAGIAQQQTEETVTCAVGGEVIKKSEAKVTYEYEGKTYYFCCEGCKEKFIKEPEKYIQKKAEMKEMYTCSMHPEVMSEKPGKCPKCGMNLEKKMMAHAEMRGHEHMEMKQKEGVCCPMMEMMKSKDVEIKFENLEDGISVKITSTNPEMVKKIQEHAAKMKTMCTQEGHSCKKEEEKKK